MNSIKVDQLPFVGMSHQFHGDKHGAPISMYIVQAPPGRGPKLHTHPYVEVVIVQEGRSTVTVGNEQREAGPGDIIVIPADTPHRFINSGDATLRQIDIHGSPRFIQTDLE